ncbi:hypothetical protein FRC00_012314 [Tulasnella sp. 408]|nr:hypothetical protein FRC00_012314 [Tulasnella sp. 408]
MITKFVGPDDASSLNSWTSLIVNEIKGGMYKDAVPEWLSCSDINDAANCATQWAIDTNKLVCDYVLKTDPEGKELSGSYYRGAAPLIQQQIAKGGVRLASWLNQIFGAPQEGHHSLFGSDGLVLQISEVEL